MPHTRSATLRNAAAFVLVTGSAAALYVGFSFGVAVSYSDDPAPLRGIAYGLIAFAPSVFMWAVLHGLADVVDALAGRRDEPITLPDEDGFAEAAEARGPSSITQRRARRTVRS